jgi:hypothetical protein
VGSPDRNDRLVAPPEEGLRRLVVFEEAASHLDTGPTVGDSLVEEVLWLVAVGQFGVDILTDGPDELQPRVIERFERADSRSPDGVSVADCGVDVFERGGARLGELETLADDRVLVRFQTNPGRSRCTRTGLRSTASGAPAAMSVMCSPEVFDTSSASAGVSSTKPPKTARFASRSSETVSSTTSAPDTPAARSVVNVMASTAASGERSVIPRSRRKVSASRTCSRARSRFDWW